MSNLAEKIESLPVPVRIEIEDFVDFVASRRSSLGGIPRHLIDPVHGSFTINQEWLDKAISEGRE